MIQKSDVKDMYFLTPMQEGMLLYYVMDKTSPVYFEQTAYHIHGELDHKLFEQAYKQISDRYDILRTIFVHEKVQRPIQVVLKNRSASVYYKNISGLDKDEQERWLKEFKNKDKEKGFDLQKDILIRLSILQTAHKRYEIIWSFHHIIMDGWCINILVKDIMLAYHCLLHGREVNLPPAKPYKNYIKWLEEQDKEKGLDYWREYLAHYEDPAVIPSCYNDEAGVKKNYVQKEFPLRLDGALTGELIKISKENTVTVSTIFQTLWGILLQKYNDTGDVVFGSVSSGRPASLEGIETMVGLFINTIPVRIKNEPGETCANLLAKVQAQQIQSKLYEFISLAEIQAISPAKRGLVNHILIFENYPLDKEVEHLSENSGLQFSVTGVEAFEQTNYDLNIIAALSGEGELIFKIKYNSIVYSADVMEGLGAHLLRITEQVAANPGYLVEEIEIITVLEKEQLLFEFNDTAADYPPGETIHELFEEQVKRTPHAIALIHEYKQLSYSELNQRANQLARELRKKGVERGSCVGIMMERSLEMIVGVFGILKSGGAFLPVDPEYPAARIRFLLEDSDTQLVLTHHPVFDRDKRIFENAPVEEIILIDDAREYPAETITATSPGQPDELAYIIYTSGTTGNPKGVMIQQRGIVNYIRWAIRKYVGGLPVNFPLYTSISFDLTLTSIFAPLLSGNTTIIYSEEVREELVETIIRDRRIGAVKLTPSHLKLIRDKNMDGVAAGSFAKRLIVGGENLETALAEDIAANFNGNIEIFNEYGPTETVVGSMIYKFEPGRVPGTSVPIGKPINNTHVLIVDKHKRLQPVGGAGELLIAGGSLARGYLNRPELTMNKFIQVPFLPGKRMYRTGDRARRLPDGNMEFLGRLDNQVKVRGFRIELGEIEAGLLKHEAIVDAVVIAKENRREDGMGENPGEKYLYSYFVAGRQITVTELREHLAPALPEYMIPSYFVQLEEIPLTPHGKVDQKALPEPDGSRPELGALYLAPETDVEKAIAEAWQETLNLEKVGLHDNFFDLGGISLDIFRLSRNLKKKLNREDDFVIDMFRLPTISAFSQYISGEKSGTATPGGDVDRSTTLRRAGKKRLEQKSRRTRRR